MESDIVIINGKVMTIDSTDSIKESVAIMDTKIIFTGRNSEVQKFIGKSTKVIDAEGKTIMPGFIDSHIHFLMYGLLGNAMINIEYDHAQSIDDIKKIIRNEVKNRKPGEWIVLSGYDHNKLIEKRHPTIKDLDEVAPENPVQCIRCCAHMAVYNTIALNLGCVGNSNSYTVGEVDIDSNGVMTGLLKETAHMELSKKVIFKDEHLREALKIANKIMLENGITSVHEAGNYGEKTMNLINESVQEGLIDVRINHMIFDVFGKDSIKEYIDDFLDKYHTNYINDEKFKAGPIKIMIDGSSSGPSSAVIEPYSHDEKLKGILVWKSEEIDEVVLKVHKEGYQMTAHAVGDKAVELIVNAYEKALKLYPRDNCRHRIEHCGLNNKNIINKIKKLNIIPVANPSFITINGSDYNRFYGERVNHMFPLKTYDDEGIIVAVGSDSPVTNPNPMFTIYGALNRKDMKKGEYCGINERVNINDILKMFTYNGAYASFEENIKGSIEEGKLADIILLSEDISKCPKEEIMNVKVDVTIIDGDIKYIRSLC